MPFPSCNTFVRPLAKWRQVFRATVNLVMALTKREAVGRYSGSVMGIAWPFFNPNLMLLVFAFVFRGVQNALGCEC
jgi:ABC-type polysaccharide/polyol phosphate export permease